MKKFYKSIVLIIGILAFIGLVACRDSSNKTISEYDDTELSSYPLVKTKASNSNTFTRIIDTNTKQKYYKMWYENNSEYAVDILLSMNGKPVRKLNIGANQGDGLVGDFSVQDKKYYNQIFEYRVSSQNGYILDGYATFKTDSYEMEK